jgi:hypothetical protein
VCWLCWFGRIWKSVFRTRRGVVSAKRQHFWWYLLDVIICSILCS